MVYLKAQTDADCIGMGTTLVGLILQEATLWVVNVGTAGPTASPRGGIRRITRDHSVVEDLVARGGPDPRAGQKPPPEKPDHSGPGHLQPGQGRPVSGNRLSGDAILLCSDGLVNQVTDQEICQEIQV